MDIEAAKRDVLKVLGELPEPFVDGLIQSVLPHLGELAPKIPAIIALLKPHVRAGAIDYQLGGIDEGDLKRAGLEVFGTYSAMRQAKYAAANGG